VTDEEEERLRALLAQLSADDVKRLKEIIEADRWRERAVYMARQVLIWIGILGGAVAALKAMGFDVIDGISQGFRHDK